MTLAPPERLTPVSTDPAGWQVRKGVRLIIPNLRTGGGERVCTTLANWWAAAGIDVEILLVHSDGEFRRQLDQRVKVVSFAVGRVAKALLPVTGFINRTPDRPTLVFGLDFGAGLGLLRRVGVLQKPFVYREGSAPEHKSANFLYRAGVDYADGIVVQTSYAQRTLMSIGVRRPVYTQIPNPLMPHEVQSRPRSSSTNALRMLAIGRLEPVKGYDRLLDALRIIRQRAYPDATLTIMGSGSQESALRRRIETLGLQPAVSIERYVEDVPAACADYDVFIMASLYEGMPNALIEALSCGTRVVAPDIPAIRELMTGIHLERCLIPNDSFAEESLNVVRAVLSQPDEVWHAARRATRERFGIAGVAQRYLNFCRFAGTTSGVAV